MKKNGGEYRMDSFEIFVTICTIIMIIIPFISLGFALASTLLMFW